MGIQGAHSSVARFRVFYKTTSGVAIVESRFESRLLREARLEPEARLRRERRSFQVSRDLWTWKLPVYLLERGGKRYSSRLWNGMDTVLEISADLSRETDSTPRLNDRFNVLL